MDVQRHYIFDGFDPGSEYGEPGDFHRGEQHNFKRGNGALGAAYLVEARRLARKNPNLPVSRQLASPIEQVLEPFRKSQWFFNLSMLGQYDSNIQQIPTSASAQQGSSRSTSKTTILAGFGYMGPPLAELQFVPSYRFNANKNFASGLEAYEYASNTLAVSLNWRALARFSAGMKAELTHSFQNFDGSYRSYTAAGDVGPFIKWTQSENLQLQLEASLRPLVNFAQTDLGGTGSGFRLGYRRDGATRVFNPTISIGLDFSGTRNATYRSRVQSVSFSNLIRLSGDHQLTPGVDYTLTDYADANPSRSDRTLAVRMSWVHPISAQWTPFDAAFVPHTSAQDLYPFVLDLPRDRLRRQHTAVARLPARRIGRRHGLAGRPVLAVVKRLVRLLLKRPLHARAAAAEIGVGATRGELEQQRCARGRRQDRRLAAGRDEQHRHHRRRLPHLAATTSTSTSMAGSARPATTSRVDAG